MDSSKPRRDPRLNEFLRRIASRPDDQFPDWVDAQDLSRLHVQAFSQIGVGGFDVLKSRGSLRLAGFGVRGHSVDFTDAGQILGDFQNLVTASGAAVEGQTGMRGRIKEDTVRRTRLALTASPAPGSVILKFEPFADEAAERYPGGQASLDDPRLPLVERSVETALSVLSVAGQPNLGFDQVEMLFAPLGARVASAAKSLATTASNSALDLHLTWERAGVGRKRVTASAASFAAFAVILEGTGLDSEPLDITGQLRTISDRRKIDLEIQDPDNIGEVRVISVERAELNLSGFRLGDWVQMRIRVEVNRRPGGGETKNYRAMTIETLGGSS